MKIERQTFDMTLVPAVYLSLGLLCGTKKLITYFPNTTSKGLVASSAISATTAIASACLFKEVETKRRTVLIFSSALSVVLLPEAIKKLYNIEKPSGYPKFFVAQALTYVFLENFRDSSFVQPQDEPDKHIFEEPPMPNSQDIQTRK